MDLQGNKTLWGVCLDPRPLNAHLPDDNFPIPLISEILERIGGSAIFTTIDLKQAYHRLPIYEEDRPLTAFCQWQAVHVQKGTFWSETSIEPVPKRHVSNTRRLAVCTELH